MARNPLIRSYPRRVNKPLPNKSAGILDDHAVRKVVATKELYVSEEAIFEDSVTIRAGVPTLIFDDTHMGHDKYRIRIDDDMLKIGSGSPIVDHLVIEGNGTNEVRVVNSDLVLEKTSGRGIKVDKDAATFGWRDLLGEIRTRGVGATDPNDAVYIGNIKAFQFAVNDEAWMNFHIPHDYVPGTDIHLHFHWSHNSTVVTGGSVTWGSDVTYSKGHDQAPFITPVNPTVVGNANTTQYQQIITEVQISAASPSASQIDTDNLEPDGVIMLRAYLASNDITSSGGVPDPFLHFVDIHYQSTNISTKDKVPDFYT